MTTQVLMIEMVERDIHHLHPSRHRPESHSGSLGVSKRPPAHQIGLFLVTTVLQPLVNSVTLPAEVGWTGAALQRGRGRVAVEDCSLISFCLLGGWVRGYHTCFLMSALETIDTEAGPF